MTVGMRHDEVNLDSNAMGSIPLLSPDVNPLSAIGRMKGREKQARELLRMTSRIASAMEPPSSDVSWIPEDRAVGLAIKTQSPKRRGGGKDRR